jgi:hypothetical protein
MAAAVTEVLVERMIESTSTNEVGVTELFHMLQHNIDQNDGVILNGELDATAAEVYGNGAQIDLMRRMWQVAQEQPWVRQDVEDLDDEVEVTENEGRGPLFYRLIVMIYKEWSKKWKLEDDESGSEDGGGDDGGDDEEDDEEDEAYEMEDVEEVQVSGNAHVLPMAGGADMQALLAGLKDVYKGQARGVADGRGAGVVLNSFACVRSSASSLLLRTRYYARRWRT